MLVAVTPLTGTLRLESFLIVGLPFETWLRCEPQKLFADLLNGQHLVDIPRGNGRTGHALNLRLGRKLGDRDSADRSDCHQAVGSVPQCSGEDDADAFIAIVLGHRSK